jgi:thiamine biosynthesis lipoprotein
VRLAETGGFFSASIPAFGTTATLVLSGGQESSVALGVLRDEIDAMDLAASRFRTDSELVALNASAGSGTAVPVSDLLFESVEVALRAARLTGGLVDPTVGRALELVGYDRDFSRIDPDGPPLRVKARPAPGWKAVIADAASRSVLLPRGVVLDLGATAKALCADRAARRLASLMPCGVLVSFGGDLSVAGEAPEGGWPIRISDNHSDPLDGPGPTVSLSSGGLATSSTGVRRWVRGGATVHHILDPATGLPAAERWRTVSVAAGSCVDANIASCASILMGPSAPAWLEERKLPARLVDPAGAVTVVGGWPEDGADLERLAVTR